MRKKQKDDAKAESTPESAQKILGGKLVWNREELFERLSAGLGGDFGALSCDLVERVETNDENDKTIGKVVAFSTAPCWMTECFQDLQDKHASAFPADQFSEEWYERILFVRKETIEKNAGLTDRMLIWAEALALATGSRLLDSSAACGCSCVSASVPLHEVIVDPAHGHVLGFKRYPDKSTTHYARILESESNDDPYRLRRILVSPLAQEPNTTWQNRLIEQSGAPQYGGYVWNHSEALAAGQRHRLNAPAGSACAKSKSTVERIKRYAASESS